MSDPKASGRLFCQVRKSYRNQERKAEFSQFVSMFVQVSFCLLKSWILIVHFIVWVSKKGAWPHNLHKTTFDSPLGQYFIGTGEVEGDCWGGNGGGIKNSHSKLLQSDVSQRSQLEDVCSTANSLYLLWCPVTIDFTKGGMGWRGWGYRGWRDKREQGTIW